MIKGLKHLWCGTVNWENKPMCNCPAFKWDKAYKEKVNEKNGGDVDAFEPVTLDHPQLEKLGASIKEVAGLLGINMLVDYLPQDDNDLDESPAIILDGWLMITPTTIKQESIIGDVPVKGFSFDAIVIYPQTRHEPESQDYKHIKTVGHLMSAVQQAIEMTFANRIQNAIETVEFKSLYEEQ